MIKSALRRTAKTEQTTFILFQNYVSDCLHLNLGKDNALGTILLERDCFVFIYSFSCAAVGYSSANWDWTTFLRSETISQWCCTTDWQIHMSIWNSNSHVTDRSFRYPHEHKLHWVPEIRTVKVLIRLRECAGWSESSLGAHVQRCVFLRCGFKVDILYILKSPRRGDRYSYNMGHV